MKYRIVECDDVFKIQKKSFLFWKLYREKTFIMLYANDEHLYITEKCKESIEYKYFFDAKSRVNKLKTRSFPILYKEHRIDFWNGIYVDIDTVSIIDGIKCFYNWNEDINDVEDFIDNGDKTKLKNDLKIIEIINC